MKAEIIDVPEQEDSVVVLYVTGLKFRDCEIYLESTGNKSLDKVTKESFVHHAEKLNRTLRI